MLLGRGAVVCLHMDYRRRVRGERWGLEALCALQVGSIQGFSCAPFARFCVLRTALTYA